MRGEVFPARPVFMEEEFCRFFGRHMQIIIDAARFFVGRCDEADQGFSQFCFLVRFGLKCGGDGDGFHDLLRSADLRSGAVRFVF